MRSALIDGAGPDWAEVAFDRDGPLLHPARAVGLWSGRAICEADGQAQKGRVTSARNSAVETAVVSCVHRRSIGGVVMERTADRIANRSRSPRLRALLGVGVVFLLSGCAASSTTAPSVSPSTAPSLTPSPVVASPGPTVASSAAHGAWIGFDWQSPVELAPYESVFDVVPWGGGYVAVGQFQNTPQSHGQAAAWFSADWHGWTRTLLDLPATGDSSILRVLPVGPNLVAIGSSGVLHCVPPEGEGMVCDPLPTAIWTSADGHSWKRASTPAALSGVTVADLAAGPNGLVLVGDTGWTQPGIWTSADGISWSRESLPKNIFASPHFDAVAYALGGWVVTGYTGGSKPICCVSSGSDGGAPAAWFSSDGKVWQAATVQGDAAETGDQIGRVFAGRGGLVAWGGRDGSTGWTSPDGRRWTARPATAGSPVNPEASDGQRIIGDSYAGGNGETFWVTTDGASWQPLTASGATDKMPSWPGAGGSWATSEFLFPNALGLVGQNGTTSFPLWLAEVVTAP